MLVGLRVAAMGIALWATPLLAQSAAPLAGDYVCQYGCRLTDANPSIQIDGAHAACMNEFGGLYGGELLSRDTVACFRKIGRLSRDGLTLVWDDGVVWKRHIGAKQPDRTLP